MTSQYTYIIYTQHKSSSVDPSQTGGIKGFANNEENAKSVLKEVLQKEFEEDKAPTHGIIVRYLNGCLTDAIWTIDSCGYNTTNHLVAGFEMDENGFIEKKIDIFDINKGARVVSKPKCLIM